MTAESQPVWKVGALCRAIADALEARFNPVTVSGEISGFSRAASGHCYFSLKDDAGQLRSAMFRRVAIGLDFSPKDGELVEIRGRLSVYEPRGELQLVVESMRRAGQGSLFEQFLQIKARLEALGLFEVSRKRPITGFPRSIGVVTSLGAAAWRDVVTALQRRVPHIPVVLSPALVQGDGAAREISTALQRLYGLSKEGRCPIDTILLVRGGGSMEDLWAFNDELLAHTISQSPVPVISGVGHETDFTIADFVADLRAPTPTAAAEMVAIATDALFQEIDASAAALKRAALRYIDRESQNIDRLGGRISRPGTWVGQQEARLVRASQRLRHAMLIDFQQNVLALDAVAGNLPRVAKEVQKRHTDSCSRAGLRLEAVNPYQVLQRGYAWLATPGRQVVSSVNQLSPGEPVVASLVDGTVDLTVRSVQRN